MIMEYKKVDEEYITRLLGGNNFESADRATLRQSLLQIFDGKTDIEVIMSAGDLIAFIRDGVLSSLAGVRRAATVHAKASMKSEEISRHTGLSKATISRMVTENRNYISDDLS